MASWRPSCDANLAHRHASLVTAGALGPTRLSDVRHVHQAAFVHQPHRPNQQSGLQFKLSPRQRRHEPSNSPRLPAVPGASKRAQQQSLEDFVANPAGSPPVPPGGSTELLNMLREMREQLEWQQNQIQGLTSEVRTLRAVVGDPQQDQPPPQMMPRQASERAPPAEFQSPPAAHVGASASSPEAAALRAQLQQRQAETEQMQRRLAQLEQQEGGGGGSGGGGGGGGGGARFVGLAPREPRAPPAAQQYPLDGRRSGAGALMSRQEKAAAAEIQAEIREMQAATTVQATSRGRIVRREVSERKAERQASNKAATAMQAAERGRAARGRAERVSAEQAVAELEAAVGEDDGEEDTLARPLGQLLSADEVEEQRRRAVDLEAAAALIQGAAASALGPDSADLEAAAALITLDEIQGGISVGISVLDLNSAVP